MIPYSTKSTAWQFSRSSVVSVTALPGGKQAEVALYGGHTFPVDLPVTLSPGDEIRVEWRRLRSEYEDLPGLHFVSRTT